MKTKFDVILQDILQKRKKLRNGSIRGTFRTVSRVAKKPTPFKARVNSRILVGDSRTVYNNGELVPVIIFDKKKTGEGTGYICFPTYGWNDSGSKTNFEPRPFKSADFVSPQPHNAVFFKHD